MDLDLNHRLADEDALARILAETADRPAHHRYAARLIAWARSGMVWADEPDAPSSVSDDAMSAIRGAVIVHDGNCKPMSYSDYRAEARRTAARLEAGRRAAAERRAASPGVSDILGRIGRFVG